jgi:hypothetical protein
MIGYYYYEDWADLVTPYKRDDCGEYIVCEFDYGMTGEAQLAFTFVEQYI